ncbi:UDP-N-acetylmuramate--L-alanine ligase [Candidatus Berkelbacteria bacterium]|nr:UDP-N-acetylmuramate--L-alanine ligase [Candidatus Berkelbacteria bacterium]
MTYHLIGINGSAMSGLAEILRAHGHEVTGSDLATTGHRAEHVTTRTARVVYSPAVTEGSPGWVEIEAARQASIEIIRYDTLLGELTQGATLVAVTGTHGKSSTTAMIAHVLEEVGQDPTVLLGAPVPKWDGRNYRVGKSGLWVLEADDFDRKFLTLHPDIAVVTTLDHDHIDVYPTLFDVQEAFRQFLQGVKDGATVIAWADQSVDPALGGIGPGVTVIRYGADRPYQPALVPPLKVLGEHMRLNATAALAAVEALGVERVRALGALASFPGTGRRLEYLGQRRGVAVYDDYGHHPTEVRATLQAFKAAYPDRRRVVAFQPHQHSRVQALFEDFAAAFTDADRLLLLDVYAVPGRNEGVRVESRDLAQAIARHGTDVRYVGDLDGLRAVLDVELRDGDAFLTMGATDITKIGRAWVRVT